jgi:hypothetical protein
MTEKWCIASRGENVVLESTNGKTVDIKLDSRYSGGLLFEEGIFKRYDAKHINASFVNKDGVKNQIVDGWMWDVFTRMVDDHSRILAREIDGSADVSGEGIDIVRILVVSPETFELIRPNKPADWIAAYHSTVNRAVIYNAEYVQKVIAGDGHFGGNFVTLQSFYEELGHEMLHSFEMNTYFHQSPECFFHFFGNSLWFIEGLKEAIARNLDAMSQVDFIYGLRKMIVDHPDFLIQTLNTNFWKFDSSPINRNLAYQYCRCFLLHLTPVLNDIVQRVEPSDVLQNEKFAGAYAVLHKAVRMYFEQGFRGSIVDVLAQKFDLSKEELFEIERKWREGLLN